MEEFIKNNSSVINLAIIIIGYVATFLGSKYSFRKELDKMKKQKIMEKMEDTHYSLTCILDDVLNAKSNKMEKSVRNINDIGNIILSYGSKDAIRIYKYLQISVRNNQQDAIGTMACLSLLICQLRYDLTSEVILPSDWFTIKLRDASSEQKQVIVGKINHIITTLDLNKTFKVKRID